MNELVSFAWPTVALILGGGALIGYRKPFGRFIDRATKAKIPGISVDAAPSPQVRADFDGEVRSPESVPAIPNANDSTSPPKNDLYSPIDEITLRELQIAFPDDVARQLHWASRAYSIAIVERSHETNYRVIFGSQIAALKALNQQIILRLDQLFPFFERGFSDLSPDLRIEFPVWYGFLNRAGYVLMHEDPARLEMTHLGRDFLIWMAARGVSEIKPY